LKVYHYSAQWDAEKNTVTGLEAWGEEVSEDLWRELDEETREFASRPAPTWEEGERDALAEFVEQRSRDFTGRDDLIGQLLDLAKSPVVSADAATAHTPTTVSIGACVTGQPGAGKSALFAKLVSELELEHDPDVLLLVNAAGTSPRSASVDAMLRRWIGELAAFLSVAESLPENASVEEVDQTFASLLGRASVKQRVVVMLDALNQFEPTPRAQHMTWRPKLWPRNARLIATALPGAEAESLSQWAGVEKIELPPLTEVDAHEIGHRVWRRYHCPWSDAVWRTLAAKRLPDDGVAAVGNPLWTTLACEQLALLDADDFTRAERQFAVERDSQARLTQLRRDLAERMPPDVPGLYAWVLGQTEKIHGEAWARAFAIAIALSRHGWRELDMRLLVPALAALLYPETPAAEITSLQLASLRRSFRAHLAVRGELQQWDFFHAQMREAIGRNLPSDVAEVRALHAALANHLLSLPSDDPLRETEMMFHLLEADDYARAAGYYGGALTEGEARGATDVLAGRVLAGDAEEPNAALALLESLLRQAEQTDFQTTANLCDRFQFELNDAIENQARLPTRRALHELNLGFLERLAGADPTNAGWQRDLWVSCYKIADLLERSEDAASLEFWRRAHEILSGMKRRGLFVSRHDEQFLARLRDKLG
jgi:NACHT domain